MEKRFERNIPAISEAQQTRLRSLRAAVIGCGGLGGYIVEILARVGLGGITVADGDVFGENNLNRQCLSLPENLGKSKARAAAERIAAIDSAVSVRCFDEYLGAENAGEILSDADIVLDALDSVPARLLLEEKCAEMGLWLVHGAVAGWQAQVCAVPPGSGMLRNLYAGGEAGGEKSVPAHVPALCAAMQCAQALRLLCGGGAKEGIVAADSFAMEFIDLL